MATRNPRPKVAAAIALAVALTLPIAVSGSQQNDEFFDSNFDGGWVGSVKVGNERVLVQLNLNLGAGDGVGFIVIQDNLGGAPSGVDVLAAEFIKVSNKSVQFRVDDDATLRRQRDTTTFKLSPKSGTLRGTASGKFKGSAELVPMRTALPLQKLWAGSVKLGGNSVFMLLQLTDNGDGTVGGHAVVDGETGDVVATADRRAGRRAGVNGTIQLSSGDLGIDLSLQKSNNQLGGKVVADGKAANIKLKPAASKGKPMKVTAVQRAALRDVSVGQANAIMVRGKNFVAGANVHVGNAEFSVDSVEFKSAKLLEVVITPAAAVPNGTSAAVLVINADGQTGERSNALTAVSDDGGGGGGGVSFASTIQPIFDQNCALAGCHSSGTASAGLVLAAGSAFDNLVGVPSSQQPGLSRVAIGNPDSSYLVRKLEGSGINGGRMPLNRAPLSAEQIASIRAWITEGAQNNRRPQ